MSDTTETFLKIHPKLTNSSTSSITENNKDNVLNLKTIIENKYIKAVLYIILILYASVIAPKLPNWLIPYLDHYIFKILIVFIIGLLATQDPVAAVIATIGVTITYLFISDNKIIDYIKDLDEDEEKPDTCNQTSLQQSNKNIEDFNTNNVVTNYNVNHGEEHVEKHVEEHVEKHVEKHVEEHFNTKNEITNHNVEYFDVLNNKHSYINHVEEHFDILNNNNVEETDDNNEIIDAYDNQTYANNANINY
jgi:hypothetical protein